MWYLGVTLAYLVSIVYAGALATTYSLGQWSNYVWLNNLRCIGSEDSLLNCSHDGIGPVSQYCGWYRHVGVQCLSKDKLIV